MAAAGLEPWLILCHAADDTETAVNCCRPFLASPERPTAVVVWRKQEAQAVVYAAHACHGLAIPRDLSVVTFSDDPLWTFPRLSAFVMPWQAMGLVAVDLMIHKIRDRNNRLAPRRLPMEWFAGTTAAPPRPASKRTERLATVG